MPCVIFLVGNDFDTVGKVSYHLVELFGIPQTERVDDIVGNGAVLGENEDGFLGICWPSACLNIVLGDVEGLVFGHLEKDIHAVCGCEYRRR